MKFLEEMKKKPGDDILIFINTFGQIVNLGFRDFTVLSGLVKEIENKRSELQNIRSVIETENAILR